MRRSFSGVVLGFMCCLLLPCIATHAQTRPQPVPVKIEDRSKPISPNLFGIFFEDISYAADGGLYAELVQNRSFEYSSADSKTWNPPPDYKQWDALTSWELVVPKEASASIKVETASPLNGNNPHYAVLTVEKGAPGIALRNEGFDGIAVQAGKRYNYSIFARQLSGQATPMVVRLESKSGEVLGSATIARPTSEWQKYTATIEAKQSDANARLALVDEQPGSIALDVVSLFPADTFHGHPNGLRADLAQTIADLHPKFMRFPGGCLVHGDGIANIYQWKETIGPIENRVDQSNIWRYHQSKGLGYYEYFQFAEDIGAKPLPVVAAGVSCQNSGHSVTGKWEVGQELMPLAAMPAYIQDVLDLIEYANGPVTSTWGSKRAAAGHPESFHLQYIGVGNEDAQSDGFRERFQMIDDAIRARHPEITVIGTVGAYPSGADYDAGWKFASQRHLEIVDEHSYEKPEWLIEHQNRYDSYDRSGPKVYVGEYSAKNEKKRSTLRSSLAEAVYMTGFERNGDMVLMSSYAPLLSKNGHSRWDPDLIHFSNTGVFLAINYYVQQMFSANSGDRYLASTIGGGADAEKAALSAVIDSKSNDLILKLINYGDAARTFHFTLPAAYQKSTAATQTLLTGDPSAVNGVTTLTGIRPTTSPLPIHAQFDYESPANSLTVLRIKQ
ncbi:MAG: alpha-L-arabinofuranosidase C-terminal domain-containing protein [Acidobacteriaceae bacterium]|nr:alpha-L-arabinofuranosidase C-terminal domain-containing protein [Acidobacteriaceae bacterium]